MTQGVPGQVDDTTAVVDLTQHVFDTIVAFFEAAGVELPKRREVVIGTLVVEDESNGTFGVMYGGTHVGPPGNQMGAPVRGDQPTTAVYNIELWRPVATGGGGAKRRSPRADVITEQAKVAMVDSWLLLRAAYACDHFENPTWNGPGVIADVAPLPPQGGRQGCSLSLQIQVP